MQIELSVKRMKHRKVAARQAEVARHYLKRAARIDELNGHPPGFDGPMANALKRYNGGRVLVHTSSLDTDLTRNTRAPHFTPQHWLLCHKIWDCISSSSSSVFVVGAFAEMS